MPAYTGIAFGLIYKITQLHKQTDYFWSSKNVGLLRTKVKHITTTTAVHSLITTACPSFTYIF